MTSPLSKGQLKRLAEIVGRENLLTDPGELLSFESDALTAYRATPAAVVFVQSTDEIRRVVALLREERIPFVPRGAGTGLSGGALADGAVIIELARLNRILWIDAENRRARVQPGVINTQLAEAAARRGLMYAPDPSSQTACTLGGNVAENSGGPHCLKYGVTTNHISALSVVTPTAELVELAWPPGRGYDLVGAFVGSEGTLGICAEIEVRLVPLPAAVETLLAHFDEVESATRAVSAIISAGIVPAALEMIDRHTLQAVEASVYAAGFPTDVAASLIVELDGPRAGLAEQAADVEALLNEHGAREVARAESAADRLKFWRARKSAFGAMGRLGSDLLVQDATVPRSRLPEILGRVYEVARKYQLTITNVFHAGDGNLHPNIPFDRRDPDVTERVHAASQEIMQACVAAGGTITGEHGVGIDKRRYMPLVYSDDDRQTMRWVKESFDPEGLCNPGKIFPDGDASVDGERDSRPAGREVARSQTSQQALSATGGNIAAFIEVELGPGCLVDDPQTFVVDGRPAETVAAPASLDELAQLLKLAADHAWTVVPAGQGTWMETGRPLARADLVVTTRRLCGSIQHQPEDLLATVQAGVTLEQLNKHLEGARQWLPLDPPTGGTMGAIIAAAAAGPLAAQYGTPRDLVLGLTVVLADGRVVKAGGQVVKNVAGYDMAKLYTGSWGTLGFIAEAHLRLHALPLADVTRLYRSPRAERLTRLAVELGAAGALTPAAAEIISPAAASLFGLESDDWLLAVRWLGHELAVGEAVTVAEQAARRCEAQPWQRSWDEWAALLGSQQIWGARLTLRADVSPTAVPELFGALNPFGSQGQAPALLASPLTGRAWIFVPAVLYEAAGDERRWALRVDELRRMALEHGGNVRIDAAPRGLRLAVDPWGGLAGSYALSAGIKRRFDPGGILKPGFFGVDH